MTEDPPEPPSRVWALAFLAVLVLLAAWRWVASGTPGGGDWAQYLSHGLALAEGRSYGDIGYLYSPFEWTLGPPRYPPGLPMTLAPILVLTGPESTVPLLLMHLFLALFAALVGVYFTRDLGPTVGWATGGMVAASFLLTSRANIVGSDLGFCALVWSVLVLADHADRWSTRRTLGILMLGCAAILYRLAGAALVPAALVLAISRRRTLGRQALLLAAGWAAVFFVVQSRFGLGEQVGGSNATGLGAGAVSGILSEMEWLLSRVVRKVIVYRQSLSEAFLYPLPIQLANNLYHVVALILAAVGLVGWLRRRALSLGAAFVGMTALMLFSVRVWEPRYIWVLMPFACYGLLAGIHRIVSKWGPFLLPNVGAGPTAPRRAVAGLSIALVLLAFGTAVLQSGPPTVDEDDDWASVAAFLHALPDSSNVRVASNRPRKVTWFTRVPAMPNSRMDLATFLSEAERYGLTHAVMTSAGVDQNRLGTWERWGRENPGFTRVLSTAGALTIYELDLSAVGRDRR